MRNPIANVRAYGRWARIGATALAAAAFAALLLAVLPPGTTADDGPAAPRGDPGSGWIPDVLAAGALVEDAQPSLTTASNGDLYLVYQTNVAGNWDIHFRSSSDGGTTWTAAVPVVASADDEMNPSITTDPFSRRIFVAYQNSTVAPAGIYIAFSDDGVAWSSVVGWPCGWQCERPRIVSEYWNGATNAQYVAFHGIESSANVDWGLLRSTDQGANWALLYVDDTAVDDVRYQPDIAVQHGTDGVDRVIVFFRIGTSIVDATNGVMAWSANGGLMWSSSPWASRVGSPPTLAASHDGDTVMVAYSASDNSDVIWGADHDPTDLTWGTGTFWDSFPLAGYRPQLAADGVGSESLLITGFYHLIFQSATANNVLYTRAPISLTGQADWKAPILASDTIAETSATYPERTITTQLRRSTWYPALAWGDIRTLPISDRDVRYTTPGSLWTFDTVPSGLDVTVDGVNYPTPVSFPFAADTMHTFEAPSPQSTAPGTRYVWASWSNGGGQAQGLIPTITDGTLVATFDLQYELTIDSNPTGRDVVVGMGIQPTPATLWLPPGTYPVDVPSPQAGAPGVRYSFRDWSDGGAQFHNIDLAGPMSLFVNFTTEYEVRIDSDPTGRDVAVDMVVQPTPATFWLAEGTHSVSVPSPQPGPPRTRYSFRNWSDGGAQTHDVDVTAPMALLVNFTAEYEVAVDSTPVGRQVAVGAATQTTPTSFWLAAGTHTISVASPQAGAPGWRYAFLNWSDGGTQAHDIDVTGPMFLSVNFTAEVQLTVNSARGGVTGAGWYDRWDSATVQVTSPQLGTEGTRHVFTFWTGDATGSQRTANVLMDGPKTVNANWQTEYYLTVTSAHGNVTGAGWYEANEEATVTLASGEVTEAGKTWEFAGWGGDATGTAPSVTVTMDGPMEVIANWREKASPLGESLGTALLLVLILVVVLFLILAVILRRRKRKKQAPAFQQMHPEAGVGLVAPALPGQPPEPTQEPPPPPPP